MLIGLVAFVAIHARILVYTYACDSLLVYTYAYGSLISHFGPIHSHVQARNEILHKDKLLNYIYMYIYIYIYIYTLTLAASDRILWPPSRPISAKLYHPLVASLPLPMYMASLVKLDTGYVEVKLERTAGPARDLCHLLYHGIIGCIADTRELKTPIVIPF